MRISGCNAITIDKVDTTITFVKSGSDVYFIWFEDVRDIDHFNTTGFILKKVDSEWTIAPVRHDGIIPKNIEEIIQHIQNIEPNWHREI